MHRRTVLWSYGRLSRWRCRILPTLAVAIAVAGGAHADEAGPVEGEAYLEAARRFARAVLEHGRDVYGDEHSPLFVDGLHMETLAPTRWQHETGYWIQSNFASHQPLLRLLDGLTELTGEGEYREAAEAAAAYAMEHAVGESGLLHWGYHATFDLETGRGVYGNTHELKSSQPYYHLLWRMNPRATRKLLEAIWAHHVRDWGKLDFDRHGYNIHRSNGPRPRWDHDFIEDLEVPFLSERRGGLAFVSFALTLIDAGAALAEHEDHEAARAWTRRMARRVRQGNDPATGLGGGQINHLALERGTDQFLDRAVAALGHVHPRINEGRMLASYLRPVRYERFTLGQMQVGERLLAAGGEAAELGREMIDWASEDLKAYAEHVWDPDERHFRSVLIDGTPLQWGEARQGYFTNQAHPLGPAEPNGNIFWAYATAYRVTGDPAHWGTFRQLLDALGLGDAGTIDGEGRSLASATDHRDWMTLLGLLDLYEATSDEAFLRLATRIGDNLVAMQTESGLFPRDGREWGRTGEPVALVLLHLAAAIQGLRDAMPPAVVDRYRFHARWAGDPLRPDQQRPGDNRTFDDHVYFGPIETGSAY